MQIANAANLVRMERTIHAIYALVKPRLLFPVKRTCKNTSSHFRYDQRRRHLLPSVTYEMHDNEHGHFSFDCFHYHSALTISYDVNYLLTRKPLGDTLPIRGVETGVYWYICLQYRLPTHLPLYIQSRWIKTTIAYIHVRLNAVVRSKCNDKIWLLGQNGWHLSFTVCSVKWHDSKMLGKKTFLVAAVLLIVLDVSIRDQFCKFLRPHYAAKSSLISKMRTRRNI